MAKLKDYKKYKRFPIQISSQNIILIHLFNDYHGGGMKNSLENVTMQEESEAVDSYNREENPANQFFKQLEGHYSDHFLKNIIIEATRFLVESDEKRNEMSIKMGRPEDVTSRAKEALEKAEGVIKNQRNVIIEKFDKNK